MVKNEESNLPKCLESLKPLLMYPDVELIIIDTGSDDNTIEIAKKYTDNVYYHEWNNHFADMRNISISYAQGEWLFIIDADEVLINSKELYNLLKGSNISAFNTIKIRETNYLNKKLTDYIIHETERLFKNNEFKYVGTVHNQPLLKEPVFFAKDIWLEHFGYINDDFELMEKKFNRTVTLLKKELEEDPNNIYYLYQLNKSYCMIQNYDAAFKQIKKAYDLIENSSSQKIRDNNLTIYGELARVGMTLKKFDVVKEACEKGLSINQNYMDLHFLIGHYYYLQDNESKKAIAHYEQYLKLYNKYSKEMFNENYVQELFTLREEYWNEIVLKASLFYFKQKKYKKALKLLKESSDELSKIHLKIKILLAQKNYNNLFLYLQRLKREQININDDFSPYSYIEMERQLLNETEKEKLTSVFADDEGIYGLLNKIRLDPSNRDLLNQLLSENQERDLPDYFLEIYVYLIGNSNNFFQILKYTNTSKIKMIVGFALKHDRKNIDYFINLLLKTKVRENDFHSNRVLQAIGNVVLLEENNKNKREEWGVTEEQENLFNIYLYYGINYVKMLYQQERLRYVYSTLPISDEKFLIVMFLLNEEKADSRKVIQYFKDALNCYPYYAEYLEEYRKSLFNI